VHRWFRPVFPNLYLATAPFSNKQISIVPLPHISTQLFRTIYLVCLKMIKTRMSAKMHFTIKLNLVNQLVQQLKTVKSSWFGNCYRSWRARFRLNSINLDKKVEIGDLPFMRLASFPCNCKVTSLNFVKISVDCDSQDTVSVTPFDSYLLCAATGTNSLHQLSECATLPTLSRTFLKPLVSFDQSIILCHIFSKFWVRSSAGLKLICRF